MDEREQSLFQAIIAAGIEHDSHESDLYVPDTQQVRATLARFPTQAQNARPFRNRLTGAQWLDIPFAFTPWWEGRAGKRAAK